MVERAEDWQFSNSLASRPLSRRNAPAKAMAVKHEIGTDSIAVRSICAAEFQDIGFVPTRTQDKDPSEFCRRSSER